MLSDPKPDSAASLARRSSGLLLHITSLPGRFGSGELSSDAFAFIDFAAGAGQAWWQMLPVNPASAPPGNCPYDSISSFAGSPMLVSLEKLGEEGLLTPRELAPEPAFEDGRVNWPVVCPYRTQHLRIAFARFARMPLSQKDEFYQFCSRHDWLENFILYCALKEHFHKAPWHRWERPLRQREPAALESARRELAEQLDFHRFVQYQFHRQWQRLRQYAQERGIGLIGDIPMFVAHDSADVWANPHLFQLDDEGRPTHVSGYPPDPFCKEGQRWGHPQYQWEAHRKTRYAWWVSRFAAAFGLFDALRIDHFLGLSRAWSIPAETTGAAHGQWMDVPGAECLTALRCSLGNRPLIVEDLGRVTADAAKLRDDFRLPGMRIAQWAFGKGEEAHLHRPEVYPPHCIAYSGTHDTDTLVGWLHALRPRATARRALAYAKTDLRHAHWGLIARIMASPANTALFPVQDLLGLDSHARMNTPGTYTGNWAWRLTPGALSSTVGRQLRSLTQRSGRLAGD